MHDIYLYEGTDVLKNLLDIHDDFKAGISDKDC